MSKDQKFMLIECELIVPIDKLYEFGEMSYQVTYDKGKEQPRGLTLAIDDKYTNIILESDEAVKGVIKELRKSVLGISRIK